MTSQPWQFETASGRCSVSGQELQEGDEFYTVLFEDGESFRRADCSISSWDGPPEGCFCFFKTRVPVKAKRRKLLVDDQLLSDFFVRLADETEPVRVQFRFVLALILMRKRILRYDESVTEDGHEIWTMTLTRDQSVHRVENPHLTDEQITDVSGQLSAILHNDMGEWAGQAESDGSTEVGEPSSADAAE